MLLKNYRHANQNSSETLLHTISLVIIKKKMLARNWDAGAVLVRM